VLGALVALLSAFSFSLSDVSVRRGVARASASHAAFVTILIGVPLFIVAALVTGQLLRADELSGKGYLLFIIAGVEHYVVGRFFNYAAISAIGAARSSPIQSLALPYSVLVAYVALGEGVTTGMAIGMAMIFVGPAIIVERRPGPVPVLAAENIAEGLVDPGPAAPFQLRQAEGYLYALIAAIAYGSSPVLIRAALEDTSGLSVLGGLISYVAAALFLLGVVLVPLGRPLRGALKPETFRTFFGTGCFVFVAQMLRFTALSLASVAVVATLLRFTGIFTLFLSWLLNRNLERISWRLVVGVVMSLAGAVLLVLTRAD
jgi:drug/metabolite transporter (DMT)-like permease